jgi:hypothetical protein
MASTVQRRLVCTAFLINLLESGSACFEPVDEDVVSTNTTGSDTAHSDTTDVATDHAPDLIIPPWENIELRSVQRTDWGTITASLCIDPNSNPPGVIHVRNRGGASAGSFVLGVGLLRSDGSYYSCDDLWSDGLASAQAGYWDQAYCCSALDGEIGAYRVHIVADLHEEVAESDELNNVGESGLFVVVPEGPISCSEVAKCILACSDCDRDCADSCEDDCVNQASEGSLAAWQALIACSDQCPDTDDTCLESMCSAEIQACAESTESSRVLEALRLAPESRP